MAGKFLRKNIINIAFSTNDNYVQHLSACIASILCNAALSDSFNFYILNRGLTEKNKQILFKLKKIKNFNMTFVEIDTEKFNICPLTTKHITIDTYYRYLIPSLFKDLDKVLYLDCDIIVKSSLKDMFNTDISDFYAAVVEDVAPAVDSYKVKTKLDVSRYFNAGVMLMNIKKMNEDNIVDRLFENTKKLADENKITWVDQCVLNYTLKGNVKFIHRKYNLQFAFLNDKDYVLKTIPLAEYNEAIKDPVVIHYTTGIKPWNCNYHYKTGKEYFKYLDKTYFGRSDLERIFSIRNSYDKRHKVVSLLGLKVNIRKRVK